ncbi:hypothetical protein CACET_c16880 [Clostridium aceticum]|uniref:Uncharacterized protein n=1 Tax=Clostridium aceticum TaxID=84022 RepID=A0A0D8ID47_9CLOT|nr:hypothetical protein [Clostridium aceticum]AKL95137.1 hypothetical protein CACET_c16880 [Clostridium aceticum]KJF28014.1 hypothetical protein TZ02_05485 [Clostridium aceticum]
MKKLLISIVFAAIMFSTPAIVFANAGPVFWQGHPSSTILSIEENSPIRVEKEDLVFDFSDDDHSFHTISGKVTATYEMFNPTNELQSVQMAFPFIGTLDSFVGEEIVITEDENVLEYDVYIGDVVNSYRDPLQVDKRTNFDFKSIVGTVTKNPYKAKHFTETEKGKRYIIDVKPTTDQRINFVIDFNFDHKKTKVLTNGFNRYERSGEKTKIAVWCYEPETLEVFVLGEDIDLKISAYTDGEFKEKTNFFTYEILTQEIELKQYLISYITSHINSKNIEMISDNQIYNLYAKSFDEYLTQNMGYVSEHDLLAQQHDQRMLTLVYTVEFPQNGRKTVGVSYRTSGTMDKTKTVKPLHTFEYILNPAANWKDFKNLNIKIITPEEAPYVVKSNIEWLNQENKLYTATLSSLPEEDLFFTLYAEEKITLLDKVGGNLQKRFGYLTPIVLGLVGLLMMGAVVMVILYKKTGNELE